MLVKKTYWTSNAAYQDIKSEYFTIVRYPRETSPYENSVVHTIVIHCDDVQLREYIRNNGFFDWYSQLQIPHKIFIHGNPDLPFELEAEASKSIIPQNCSLAQ